MPEPSGGACSGLCDSAAAKWFISLHKYSPLGQTLLVISIRTRCLSDTGTQIDRSLIVRVISALLCPMCETELLYDTLAWLRDI
ncbi:uncharacterized protein P174DRAFT_288285 [Aspergillus novofumigatus IBT 16806]|uniref:Uncharacterized protein n=1 Tax=Aspergillus novofumigatus (strain IBT 16806) TaxID=1392255 RepID=A0A2I1BXF8_ASPN1|nr:uncharacterized protein P174DRAFT_288285 [Aspergillus novofumigatus IBT 16806]PKX90001.1 hypothetical protein P174DRAFT_288285 [Aspergillus novofumigatus IBT 16806]